MADYTKISNAIDSDSSVTAASSKAVKDAYSKLDGEAVHKTGNETIEGDKTFSGNVYFNGYNAAYSKNNNVKKGTVPSSNQYINYALIGDGESSTGSTRLGLLESIVKTDGSVTTSIAAYKNEAGATTHNLLSITTASDGTTYATCPTPASSSNDTKIATTAWTTSHLNNKRTIKRCRVGQSSNTSNITEKPWYKFASVNINVGNDDRQITFKVSQGYADNTKKSGILTAHIRTNSSGLFNSAELIWEYALEGINVNDFVLAYKNGTNSTDIELWCKQTQSWGIYHFEVLSEHKRDVWDDSWVLYSAVTDGQAATPTSDYTQIVSKTYKIINALSVDTINAISDLSGKVNGYYSISSATLAGVSGGWIIVKAGTLYTATCTSDPRVVLNSVDLSNWYSPYAYWHA